jgi:hypothetical protein
VIQTLICFTNQAGASPNQAECACGVLPQENVLELNVRGNGLKAASNNLIPQSTIQNKSIRRHPESVF